MWFDDDDCFTDMPYWVQATEIGLILAAPVAACLGAHPLAVMALFLPYFFFTIWIVDTNPKRSGL